MAQHIGIQIVDEDSNILNHSDLNIAELQKFISSEFTYNEYPLLSSIDEYGLTFFNSKQLINLLAEITVINFPPSMMHEVDELMAYISQIEMHQFLKVIGD
jgi:hypothetical protein